MIKTKRFQLTPKDFFMLLLIRYVKKRWWLLAWLWAMAIIMISMNMKDSFTYFFFGFCIAYPLLLVFQFWRYVNSKTNTLLLNERHYEIDNDKITTILDKDTHSTIKMEHFTKIKFMRNTYLLFITKNQFVYIPANSFESIDDRTWFDNEIISRIKK